MNPTLNSPKYADPKSLAFQMYKIQQERKNRKKFVPQLEQRYFRRNEGTTDYATIPEVTLAGDFVIEFDSLGGIDTYGRLLGNAASFDNEVRLNNNNTSLNMKFSGGALRTINFDTVIDRNEFNRFKISRVSNVVTLTINKVAQAETVNDSAAFVLDTIHRSNTRYNTGILANLKIYDNGTLIRDYPINDNSSTIRDLANGQDGTIINGNAGDWGLFDKQANGDWLGQELVVNGGFDGGSGWTLGAGWSISGGEAIYDGLNGTQSLAQNPVPLVEGASYILSLVVLDNSGSGLNTVFLGDSNTISASHLPVGEYSFNGSAISSRNVSIFGRANEVFAIDNISVKEVLKNA